MSLKIKVLLLSALTVIINLVVFYPSFQGSARGDHMIYLIETAEFESLPELVSQTYSYCRTRLLNKGDEILFRPLFYVMTALEKHFFSGCITKCGFDVGSVLFVVFSPIAGGFIHGEMLERASMRTFNLLRGCCFLGYFYDFGRKGSFGLLIKTRRKNLTGIINDKHY